MLRSFLLATTFAGRSRFWYSLRDFDKFCRYFLQQLLQNGILPIVLSKEQVEALMEDAENGANAQEVDLEAQTVTSSDGDVFNFEIDAFKKHCLLNGLDDISLNLEKSSSMKAMAVAVERPWV